MSDPSPASVGAREESYRQWRQRLADKQEAMREPEDTGARPSLGPDWSLEALFADINLDDDDHAPQPAPVAVPEPAPTRAHAVVAVPAPAAAPRPNEASKRPASPAPRPEVAVGGGPRRDPGVTPSAPTSSAGTRALPDPLRARKASIILSAAESAAGSAGGTAPTSAPAPARRPVPPAATSTGSPAGERRGAPTTPRPPDRAAAAAGSGRATDAAPAADPGSLADQLRELNRLRVEGKLTDEQFNDRKAALFAAR